MSTAVGGRTFHQNTESRPALHGFVPPNTQIASTHACEMHFRPCSTAACAAMWTSHGVREFLAVAWPVSNNILPSTAPKGCCGEFDEQANESLGGQGVTAVALGWQSANVIWPMLFGDEPFTPVAHRIRPVRHLRVEFGDFIHPTARNQGHPWFWSGGRVTARQQRLTHI